jgi:hypothetical protein
MLSFRFLSMHPQRVGVRGLVTNEESDGRVEEVADE